MIVGHNSYLDSAGWVFCFHTFGVWLGGRSFLRGPQYKHNLARYGGNTGVETFI